MPVRFVPVLGIRAVICISLHALAWGATAHDGRSGQICDDFNPRTRVGCDTAKPTDRNFKASISIHAPAWGATARSSTLPTKVKISIHAPAWGATSPSDTCGLLPLYFNPRTRMGCDYSGWRISELLNLFQSTHPHGVRHFPPAYPPPHPCNFNPRTRMGCAPHQSLFHPKHRNFNPRTRMGCDYRSTACRSSQGYFNPRTRMGCDRGGGHAQHFGRIISIHAPAWGATSIGFLTI